ncbi:MAG: tRNA (N6-isopentenyl adenosine(37)-C2)-methylthiotransferase MiaB [Oligoflexales bacterium]|nr:tRNA (N6-isopentenyl adenosine(37)-C2)-methylthiotransferase MiaB [Oligoflexales bacterium]
MTTGEETHASKTENDVSRERKVLIETWGCQMNVVDSEQMLSLLKTERFTATDRPDDADLILLNTCNIREKAKHKLLSRLGELRLFKIRKPSLKIAVAGCISQMEGARLIEEEPLIDIILGPGKKRELPGLWRDSLSSGKRQVATGFSEPPADREQESHTDKELSVPDTLSGRSEVSRFVTIIEGCQNYCTYCVVPYARGKEISRPKNEILREIREHVRNGVTEITLLGQNVNSYGIDLIGTHEPSDKDVSLFADLLRDILPIEGLRSLRFTTSNPHNFTKDIAELFRSDRKLGRHIHLPLQSGDNEILARMNRRVTVEEYLKKTGWLREIDREFAISTDLIVGFPGESQEQFYNTMSVVEKVRYSFIYGFMYSPRPGTAAAGFRDQVPQSIKKKRLAELLALQDEITLSQNLQEIGRTRRVHCLYKNRKEDNSYYGRTEHFRLVKLFSKEDIIGKDLKVEITAGNKTALLGTHDVTFRYSD